MRGGQGVRRRPYPGYGQAGIRRYRRKSPRPCGSVPDGRPVRWSARPMRRHRASHSSCRIGASGADRTGSIWIGRTLDNALQAGGQIRPAWGVDQARPGHKKSRARGPAHGVGCDLDRKPGRRSKRAAREADISWVKHYNRTYAVSRRYTGGFPGARDCVYLIYFRWLSI